MAVALQTLIDNVEAAINARLVGGAVQSYTIGARNLQYMTLAELRQFRTELKNEYANSQGGKTRTLARFK